MDAHTASKENVSSPIDVRVGTSWHGLPVCRVVTGRNGAYLRARCEMARQEWFPRRSFHVSTQLLFLTLRTITASNQLDNSGGQSIVSIAIKFLYQTPNSKTDVRGYIDILQRCLLRTGDLLSRSKPKPHVLASKLPAEHALRHEIVRMVIEPAHSHGSAQPEILSAIESEQKADRLDSPRAYPTSGIVDTESHTKHHTNNPSPLHPQSKSILCRNVFMAVLASYRALPCLSPALALLAVHGYHVFDMT